MALPHPYLFWSQDIFRLARQTKDCPNHNSSPAIKTDEIVRYQQFHSHSFIWNDRSFEARLYLQYWYVVLKKGFKRRYFYCGSFMFLFCLVFAMSLCASVYMCFVVTCWERADLLALVCGVYCEFVTFPLVSWVRCGTWLYRFLIFAPLLTFTFMHLFTFTTKALTNTDVPAWLAHFTHSA